MTDNENWSLSSAFNNRINSALALLEETRELITHKPSAGAAREEFFQDLLTDFLPESFVVEPGFIVGFDGESKKSGQIDVVVSRSEKLRRLARYAGFSIQPVENVYAAIEIKTKMKSSDELTKALKQVYSAKLVHPDRPAVNQSPGMFVSGGVRRFRHR